jgi:hypothetical protein
MMAEKLHPADHWASSLRGGARPPSGANVTLDLGPGTLRLLRFARNDTAKAVIASFPPARAADPR